MTPGKKPLTLSGTSSFEEVLDSACDRLWDKKVQYSMRRIHELEDYLDVLERQLDALALQGERNRTG
ncbi:MAG: hypothetical protein LBE14_05065 [Treponema sp.]|jgi:hypothetical protein|nr:hypothetical protein [Treponema sp.]